MKREAVMENPIDIGASAIPAENGCDAQKVMTAAVAAIEAKGFRIVHPDGVAYEMIEAYETACSLRLGPSLAAAIAASPTYATPAGKEP